VDATKPPVGSFEEFWPHYLRQHAKPWTRRLHYLGTGLAVLALVAAVVLGNPWILLGIPVAGYAPAWLSHLVIEKNKPVTFSRPLWSLASDFRMSFSCLAGNIEEDLRRAGVTGNKREEVAVR
jgi:hypothetical protein